MGFKQLNSTIYFEKIKKIDLDSFPLKNIQKANKEIKCTHVLTDVDFLEFGPYSSYKVIRYFLIYSEGLQNREIIFRNHQNN